MAAHVDSAAMIQAVEEFRCNNPAMWAQLGLEGQLTKVIHCRTEIIGSEQDLDTSNQWTKLITCPHESDGRCRRCAEGRSGYTFRWLSPFWADAYDRLRAKGSWAVGDPEHHSTVYLGQEFTGNLMLATGRITASSHSGLAEAAARRPLAEGNEGGYYEWEEWCQSEFQEERKQRRVDRRRHAESRRAAEQR